MSTRMRWLVLACALALPASAAATPADSGATAPDTTLGGYLRGLADSTDLYFGETAAPLDTAGLDSALAYGLANQQVVATRRPPRMRPGPWLTFNRVDGPRYGASLGIGSAASRSGSIAGRLGYAAGPNDWVGGGEYSKRSTFAGAEWSLTAGGGYYTRSMNRDHSAGALNVTRALFTGRDYTHYLRRQGWSLQLEREAPAWRASVGWRDENEIPIATSATWTLTGSRTRVPFNLAAAEGRAREVGLELGLRWPRLEGWSEVQHWTSGDAIGSDFEYRRTRAASGFELPLARVASVVSQVEYGRVSGALLPQNAFYLGGSQSIRNLNRDEKGGAGLALARVEIMTAEHLLSALKLPQPSATPIQVGAFAAVGAVWGADPYGGPAVPGLDWPNDEEWLPEVGASLLYRPGLPDPAGYIRINYAVPVGPRDHDGRWSVTYSRALDLLTRWGN